MLKDGAQIRAAQRWFHDHHGNIIDVCANGSSFGLRILGSAKDGKPDALLRLVSSPTVSTQDKWLQGEDPEWIVDINNFRLPGVRFIEVPESSHGLSNELAEIAKEIEGRYPHLQHRVDSRSFDRTMEAHCEICGTAHGRDGAHLRISKGGEHAMLYCNRDQAKECRGPMRTWLLWRGEAEREIKNMLKGLVTEYEKEESRDDGFDGLFDLEEGELEIVDVPYCSEIELGKNRLEFICSPYGTGKTRAYSEELNKLRDDQFGMIFFPRKTLGAQIVEASRAISYTTIKGAWKDEKLTAWQIDSIDRLLANTESIDLLVLDEIGATFAQIFGNGTTHREKSSRLMSAFRTLLSISKHVIVLDNDVCTEHVRMMKSAMGLTHARVLKNIHKPWANTPLRLLNGRLAHSQQEAEMMAYIDAQATLKNSGRPWKAVAVACHKKTWTMRVAAQLRGLYGPDAVKEYTGDTDDAVKREDLKDATNSWKDALVVLYTATITVGVSNEDERFERVYGFFNGVGNSTVEQSLQMLFRCRELKEIHVAVDGRRDGSMALTPWELAKRCVRAQASDPRIPSACLTGESEALQILGLDTRRSVHDLLTYSKMSFDLAGWMLTRIEKGRSAANFAGRLVRLVENMGFDVTIVDAMLRESEATKKVRSAATAAVAKRRMDLRLANLDAEYIRREEKDYRDRSEGEKLGGELAGVVAALGVVPADVTKAWATYYTPELVVKRDRRHMHLSAQETGQALLEDSSDKERGLLLETALGTMGLSIRSATGTVAAIDVESATQRAAIEKLVERGKRLFGDTNASRRKRELAAKWTVKGVAGAINVGLWSYVGGKLVPWYLTPRDKTQCNVAGYKLEWSLDVGPEPKPRWRLNPD